jgi:hypothetical protein
MVTEVVLLDEEGSEINTTPVDPNGFSLHHAALTIQRKKFGFEGASNCAILVGSTDKGVRQPSMSGRSTIERGKAH